MAGPCANATSFARIAPSGGEGPALTVEGRLFQADGVTPATGVIVYAYHTGRDGLYAPRNGEPPRLRAWLRTGPQGEFRLETIRPAPYPNDRIPAHIHFQAWGTGIATQYLEDLLFDDDRLVTDRERKRSRELGRFAFVQPVRAGSVSIQLRLKPAGDRMEESILHGLRACQAR
jgi:protocatechuate 3,4-dioxygenase beta subunit